MAEGKKERLMLQMNWSNGDLCLRLVYLIKLSPGIISLLTLQGSRRESENKRGLEGEAFIAAQFGLG